MIVLAMMGALFLALIGAISLSITILTLLSSRLRSRTFVLMQWGMVCGILAVAAIFVPLSLMSNGISFKGEAPLTALVLFLAGYAIGTLVAMLRIPKLG